MRRAFVIALSLSAAAAMAVFASAYVLPRLAVPESSASSIYDFKLKDIDGKDKALKSYKGKVILVVNVASKCGLTPQYEGLEALYKKYKDKGLVILGMPANDFAGQEPGTEAEIKQFCSSKYNVTFPMFSKITVVGESMHPLYAWLINSTGGQAIEWNFAKFLVGRDGKTITRFGSRTTPDDPRFEAAIEHELGKKLE